MILLKRKPFPPLTGVERYSQYYMKKRYLERVSTDLVCEDDPVDEVVLVADAFPAIWRIALSSGFS